MLTRQSAGTRSPSSSRTRSPATSSSAGRKPSCPSRHTCTWLGRARVRAARVRSAWNSCQKEKTPLISTTAQMAQPSWGVPAAKARPPAIHSSRAMKWTIWSRKRRARGGAWRAGGGWGRTAPGVVRPLRSSGPALRSAGPDGPPPGAATRSAGTQRDARIGSGGHDQHDQPGAPRRAVAGVSRMLFIPQPMPALVLRRSLASELLGRAITASVPSPVSPEGC